jgi:hypothetical protein
MSIILRKGSGYNASYSSTDYPVLSADWTGSISLYTTYPGTATFTKSLTRSGNVMLLALTNAEILNLLDGVYTFETTITNAVLGVTVVSVDYASVLPINISSATMCRLYGTIEKPDGTPTGAATSSLVNSVGGLVLQTGWKGVDVRASIASADVDTGKIVSVETMTTTTNASGYFEFYVIQGLTVTITCPSFGKSVAVATTGLTTVDISTFF